jgi:hypothetical protein
MASDIRSHLLLPRAQPSMVINLRCELNLDCQRFCGIAQNVVIAGQSEFLSQVFENYVADECRNDGDNKVLDRKNIFHGKNQGLSALICAGEFPHQEVGIEKDNDETHLNDCSPNRSQLSRIFLVVHCTQL